MAATPTNTRNATVARRALAAALVAFQTDVRIRRCKTDERRSGLAQPHRAQLPFRNPAPTNMDWLVCAPTSRMGSSQRYADDVRHRNGNSLPDFSATPPATTRLPRLSRAPILYPAHGQLLLLQSSHNGSLPHPARRCRAPKMPSSAMVQSWERRRGAGEKP